jgi:hypothetical protein
MSVGKLARIAAVLAACAAAAGSATSSSSSGSGQSASMAGAGGTNNPPPPQQMEPNVALGLWRSTFGAVKIEADNSHGGIAAGSLQGVWMYQRQGQEVIGYFAGNLRGNVLSFRWQEPNSPPLTGEGFLVFDVQGRQYSGRWWSDKRDRVGDWNGWRQPLARGGSPSRNDAAGAYGGQDDGYDQPAYRRPQPYQPRPYQQPDQQPPYQQPPYQQSPYQQPYPPPGQQPYQQPPYQQPYPPQRQPPPQQPPSQPTYY